MRKKKIKIGFDLDGVIIDKPPFVPKRIIEWLFKGSGQGLNYRFPSCPIEQRVRKLSHFYLLRPPIKKNLTIVKNFSQNPNYELYLISSRYLFLAEETRSWLQKRGIEGLFKKTCFNFDNQQPHLFKEEKLKKLGLDIYLEDDELIADYLKKRLKKTKIFLVQKDEDYLNKLSYS